VQLRVGDLGTNFAASFALRKQVRTEVYLGMPEQQTNKAIFDALGKEKVAIEAEFGEPLRWERLEERTASRIALYRPGSIDDDPDTLKEIQAWAIDRLLRLGRSSAPDCSGCYGPGKPCSVPAPSARAVGASERSGGNGEGQQVAAAGFDLKEMADLAGKFPIGTRVKYVGAQGS